MTYHTRPGDLPSALMRLDIDLSEQPAANLHFVRLDIDLSEHPAAGLRHNALRQDLSGAFDGVASAIPIALCGVALVYVNFPASFFFEQWRLCHSAGTRCHAHAERRRGAAHDIQRQAV